MGSVYISLRIKNSKVHSYDEAPNLELYLQELEQIFKLNTWKMYTFTSPVGVWEIPFLNMPKLSIFFFNKTSFQESILPEPTLVYIFFFRV